MITNHPARYRDPKTGLPYYNSYAFKEIQRLHRGDYRWSRLIGAWVGSGTFAARGVPGRFLDPNKPREGGEAVAAGAEGLPEGVQGQAEPKVESGGEAPAPSSAPAPAMAV